MGPQGPQGVPGATGATGPAGTTLTQIISEESEALEEGENYVYVTARCPGGEKLTGGGYYVRVSEGTSGNIVPAFGILENRPFRVTNGVDEWLVSATNRGARARDAGDLVAYVICTDKTP